MGSGSSLNAIDVATTMTESVLSGDLERKIVSKVTAMDGIDAVKDGEIQAEVTMQPEIKTASSADLLTPAPPTAPLAATPTEPNTSPEPETEPEPEPKAQTQSDPQVPSSGTGTANSTIFKSYFVALLVACKSSI